MQQVCRQLATDHYQQLATDIATDCYQQAIARTSLHMACDNLLTTLLEVAASKLDQNFQNVLIIIQKLAESAFNKL